MVLVAAFWSRIVENGAKTAFEGSESAQFCPYLATPSLSASSAVSAIVKGEYNAPDWLRQGDAGAIARKREGWRIQLDEKGAECWPSCRVIG